MAVIDLQGEIWSTSGSHTRCRATARSSCST